MTTAVSIRVRAARVGQDRAPRFEVRFVNGIWTIFDRVNFVNCEPCLGTYKNALRVLNAPAR